MKEVRRLCEEGIARDQIEQHQPSDVVRSMFPADYWVGYNDGPHAKRYRAILAALPEGEGKGVEGVPHYSGDASKPFWDKVNSITDREDKSAVYYGGVLLQNMEHEVLRYLRNALPPADKGAK